MQIVDQNKSILFENVNGRDYVILKEDIKIVKLGADSVAVYDSQSRQKDARRLVIDYSDVLSPSNINNGQGLFDCLNELINSKNNVEETIDTTRNNTSELKAITEILFSIDKTLKKIYSTE